MSERCPKNFEQALLSGFLDGELTQADGQKVRVHLEDCETCRGLAEDLRRLRGAAMKTRFVEPTDDQWSEAPRGAASLTARGLGWLVGIAWAVILGGYGLYHAWQGTEDLLEKVLVFGGLSALALLFLSVLIDRLRTARTDRYREVKR